MMVVPAETVEDTLDELLQFCVEGDIIIDHGNSNFKDSRRRAERLAKLGMSYIDCGTSGGVYGLERGYCLMVGGANFAVSACAPIFRALAPGIGSAARTNPLDYETSAEHGWLHCGPPGAGHFVKMVHNGVEYGIMQAYAEGFNILHEANAGAKYVKAGDAEVAPMENPEDYCYDIDCAEVAELWRRGSVVGSWLLDLTADVLRGNTELNKFDGGVSDSGEGRWTVHAAVDLGVPTPVISTALFERFESRRLGAFAFKILKWNEVYVRGTQCSLMHSNGLQYRLYYPRYISGYEKVKMTTTTQTTMMETEPLTRRIVIFGAAGDLCKKKLIPALYELWKKKLLPKIF